MKRLLSILFSILLCGQSFAGNIIDRGANPAEVTAQERDDIWLSPASIPYISGAIGSGDPLTILQGGTGSSNATGAITKLGAAASGNNTDITHLNGPALGTPASGNLANCTGYPIADTYDTIYVDAASMIPCTTNGALQGTNEYGTNDIDIDYFAFDAGAVEERVQFKLKMPENWDNSTIKVKIDWSSATGSTSGDTVEWAIKAGALSDNDAIDAVLGTPQVISDVLLADNGADLQITSATPALTVGGTPALGDVIVFEIYRNTDGTDDMAEDGWLFGATIQYKKTGVVAAW